MKKQFVFASAAALILASCQSTPMRIFNQSSDNKFSCNDIALIDKQVSYIDRAENLQSKLNQKLVKGTVELRHPTVKEIINGVGSAKRDINEKYNAASSSCEALADCANENDLNFCSDLNRSWARAELKFDNVNARLDKLEAGVNKIDKIKFPKKEVIEMNTEEKCELVVGTVFTECSD